MPRGTRLPDQPTPPGDDAIIDSAPPADDHPTEVAEATSVHTQPSDLHDQTYRWAAGSQNVHDTRNDRGHGGWGCSERTSSRAPNPAPATHPTTPATATDSNHHADSMPRHERMF